MILRHIVVRIGGRTRLAGPTVELARLCDNEKRLLRRDRPVRNFSHAGDLLGAGASYSQPLKLPAPGEHLVARDQGTHEAGRPDRRPGNDAYIETASDERDGPLKTEIKASAAACWDSLQTRFTGSPTERASELVYQVLLSKKPNRGCWATITIGGATRTFAILRLCTGFGSGFFGSDGLSSANDCSARDLAETSATVVWAGALTAVVAICGGTIVGRLVSKTTRSGHFRSDWILMPDLEGPVSALSASTGNFGRTPLLRNNSASRTPPTNKKYRATGILRFAPIRAGARTTRLTGDGAIGS
jgi:hypothetical protein